MIERNPKDSMKSTWRTDRDQWSFHHKLLEALGMHPTDLSKDIPKHAKDDPVPFIPHWETHRWILVHATWPLLIQQAYISYTGRNFHPLFAFFFYNFAFTYNAVCELHLLRDLGHKYGFLDGDTHDRDQIPDQSVSKVVNSLVSTAALRPMMSIFLAYRSNKGPSSLSWWLPLELGLYSIILDGWFYLYHRCMHEIDWLWQFHRTHHLTKHPNSLLTLYADGVQELWDILVIPLLTWVTMKLLGLPMGFYDWWFCHQYIVFIELFGHSGLRLYGTPASTNSWLLRWMDAELTIEDHDLHHRRGWKKSMNYGKQTLFWDRLFGTTGKRVETFKENVDFSDRVSFRCLDCFK